jgi:plasmid stabilization system protein ParE
MQATDNFIKELDESIDKICDAPFVYRNLRKHYREMKMKTYPYYIIYRINENNKEVLILRIITLPEITKTSIEIFRFQNPDNYL